MWWKTSRAVLLWTVVVLGSIQANGTMFVRQTFDEFVADVDRIVVGEVLRVDEDWGVGIAGEAGIFTTAVFRVEGQVKGQGFLEELTLRAPGGAVGDVEQWMSAAPWLGEPGERFIVFLWDEADGFLSNIAHWERGIFRVDDEGRVEGTRYSEDEFLLDVMRRLRVQEGGGS